MTTNTEMLTPKVARVPESAAAYRLVRHLEPDEAARNTAENREKNFRPGELDQMSVTGTLGVAIALGSVMYLAGSFGNWFLDASILLQLALAGGALYGTRRAFALLVGRTKAGAYYAGGDFRRHLTGADVTVVMVVATLGITHLALTPVVQAAAFAGVLIALLVAHRASVAKLRGRLEAEELSEEQALLAATV